MIPKRQFLNSTRGIPLVTLLGCLWATCAAAQTATQTFNLHAGWNAVWLEVQPADNSTAAVFSNLPVSSVWARAERVTSAEFIQNASEAAFNQAGWLGWFPPSHPEAVVNNLYALDANRAYLIKADAPFTLTVTGRPSLRQPDWVPDRYNLRGFPVDASQPPTFKAFFQYSPAQFDSAQNRLRGIYRLGASGQWAPVANGDAMKSGEACWVYCYGASDYPGPVETSADLGDGLDYGLEVDDLTLSLHNRSTVAETLTIRDLTGTPDLAVRQLDPSQGYIWPAMTSPYSLNLGAGESQDLRLAIKRSEFSSSTYGTVLEIKDGAGTRQWVSVSAEKAIAAAAPPSPGIVHASSLDDAKEHAGLWVGTATINAVAEAHSANPTNPTPTKSEFHLRLIVHVDNNGQSQLLKEVIEMQASGTYTNDPSGVPVQETPPRVVLVTDDQLIGQFEPIAVRDDQLVGRRFSSATFDFDGGETNTLPLTGTFGGTNTLTGNISMGPNFPTNPFRHKYHPDHDNLDATFQNFKMEAYPVTRNFELQFSDTGPPGDPDYGYNTIGGVYREVISGLHKRDLVLQGNFTLTRIATTGVLNQ